MSGARLLRLLSRIEGVSLLVLVLVAMPLKYVFHLPLAVRGVGALHGVLFLALVSVSFQVLMEETLPRGRVLKVLGWSLVPFGFLKIDRELRDDASERKH